MKQILLIFQIILLISCSKNVDCTKGMASDISFKFAIKNLPDSRIKRDNYQFSESATQFRFDYLEPGRMQLGGGISVVIDRSTCKIVDFYKGQ